MRLMIFTPTWLTEAGEDAIHPACRESIEAQEVDGRVRWVIGRENPFPIPDHRNVLHQYRLAREMFLAGDDDALLTVEHDQRLPDPGAAQRMLETPGDVVYAPYLLRHGRPVLSTWQYINNRNLGMSLALYPRELEQARRAGVWRICGAGFGCTLFRRRVLEAIEFAPSTASNPSPDLGFAEAALRAGFVSYGRFDAPVAHYARGRWLDPFEVFDMSKYIATQNVNVMAAGRFIRLKAGEMVELSEEEANDLLRVGYVDAIGIKVEDERPPEESEQRIRGIDGSDAKRPRRRNREATLRED